MGLRFYITNYEIGVFTKRILWYRFHEYLSIYRKQSKEMKTHFWMNLFGCIVKPIL